MAHKRRSNGQGTLIQSEPGKPFVAYWYDHTGKRRKKSTRTTDRRTAERLLAKYVADAALRRDGVVDPRTDRFSEANRVPLADHTAAYLDYCRHTGQAPRRIIEKERHLRDLLTGTAADRLSALTPEAMGHHMAKMKDGGYAPATCNFAREVAVSFMTWCVKTSRIESNPLTTVAKYDQRNGRRRVRRALTDDEMASLLAVAEPRGRSAWYLAAALAGLRKGDLTALEWRDVDFKAGTITIRCGKAKRVDVIPLHPQLAGELQRRLKEHPALPQAKVFPTVVTDVTRLKDFLRAGIARREVVTDAKGMPVMIGKGKRQRPKMKIVTEDAEGRVIDLHAMRTTLGTNLAKAGVAPQLAQRIMRHGDYRTTLKHYTVLGLVDTAKAMNAVPSIDLPQTQVAAATGTCDGRPNADRHTVTKIAETVTERNILAKKDLRQKRDGCDGCDGILPTSSQAGINNSLAGASAPARTLPLRGIASGSATGSSCGAKRRDSLRHVAMANGGEGGVDDARKPCDTAALCDDLQPVATGCDIAGEGARTLDSHVGNVTLYH